MHKQCPHCEKMFKAKRSSRKYCGYSCYVFDHIKGADRQWEMIRNYKERALPSLEKTKRLERTLEDMEKPLCQNWAKHLKRL